MTFWLIKAILFIVVVMQALGIGMSVYDGDNDIEDFMWCLILSISTVCTFIVAFKIKPEK